MVSRTKFAARPRRCIKHTYARVGQLSSPLIFVSQRRRCFIGRLTSTQTADKSARHGETLRLASVYPAISHSAYHKISHEPRGSSRHWRLSLHHPSSDFVLVFETISPRTFRRHGTLAVFRKRNARASRQANSLLVLLPYC